jgi:pimeloyl-ACP methyl ester carboxylesterase
MILRFDRRGRGESGDTAPYAVEREVEDLGALIAEAGGAASVYGHSSGAGLALNAAAGGLPVTRLVLHEPPYGSDDEESRQSARKLAESVRAEGLSRGK